MKKRTKKTPMKQASAREMIQRLDSKVDKLTKMVLAVMCDQLKDEINSTLNSIHESRLRIESMEQSKRVAAALDELMKAHVERIEVCDEDEED